jgi:Holliday junction resolvase
MKKKYDKGAMAERELVKFLKSHSFQTLRSAGSGSKFSTPDVVAIRKGIILAFECKAWQTKPKLKKDEYKEFREWCEKAGAIGFLAWRRGKNKWLFLDIKSYGKKDILKDGITLNDLLLVLKS